MKFLTVEQVAKTLAVSKKTVDRILAAGQLTCIDVSPDRDSRYTCKRISEGDLMAFLAKRRQAPQPKPHASKIRRRRRK